MITRSMVGKEKSSSSLPELFERPRNVEGDDIHFQPAMSSFGAGDACNSSRVSTRSGKSNTSTIVAKRLAAEARHAAALVRIEQENQKRQQKLDQLKIESAHRALAAEVAALECSTSQSLNSVRSWVHSLPAKFDAPTTSAGPIVSHPTVREEVGPVNMQEPAITTPMTNIQEAHLLTNPEEQAPVLREDAANITTAKGYKQNHTFLNLPAVPPQPSTHHCCNGIKNLAQAMVSHSHRPLPLFSGRATDWLAFKQTYINTHSPLSSFENVARIRSALRGEAAIAVSSLALTCTDPNELLQALEDRFARPEFIVLEELAAVRALPRLQSDYKELNVISCRVQNLVAVLKYLGRIEYLYSPELYNTLLSKLTPLLRSLWIRYAAEHSVGTTKLETLSIFLRDEARHHTQFGLLVHNFQVSSEHLKHKRVELCNTTRIVHDSGICGYCKDNHYLADCTKFKNISPDDRLQLILKSKRCFHCLGNKRHSWRKCSFYKKCEIDGCQSFHHRLLHGACPTTISHQKVCFNLEKVDNQTTFENPLPSVSILESNYTCKKPLPSVLENSSTYTCSHERPQHRQVLLKVLPVIISGPLGEFETLALLDDGSTATLIDSDTASRVGLQGPEGHIRVQGVGGMVRNDKINYVNFKIRGKYSSVAYSVENARAIKNLNLSKQEVRFTDISKYPHLSDIVQVVSFDEGTPTILIGAGDWHLTVARDIKAGTRNQPVATLTLLGWVVHGGLHSKTKPVDFINHTTTLEDIDFLVREHFKLDILGVSKYPRCFGPNHERAIRILNDTTKRLSNGRFEVGLPWKEDKPYIPDSYAQALRRLLTLERKMARDTSFADEYRQIVNGTIQKGYAEECKVDHKTLVAQTNTRFWYLPHFAVIHPKKGKIRVVHDAAAKTEGVSLNSLLLTGPDLLQSLLGILLRWREGSVALMADIREMFPQVKIREADRDMQRFLWRDGDSRAPVKEFCMSSMIFGAASSPCTAIYLLNKNAQEHAHLYPDASVEIHKNTYMDDYVGSLSDVQKAARLARDIVDLLKLGHFEMRGWISNRSEALSLIPPNLLAVSPSEVPVRSPTVNVRTLGLFWNASEDTLGFRPDFSKEVPSVLTKRIALSHVMRLFDPLGLLTPLTVHGRILLQRAWQCKIGWDESLPADQFKLWLNWYRYLSDIQNLKLPRWHLLPDYEPVQQELHVFADASESAYACVAYWRFIDARGQVHLSLVASKARVTPNKPVSIPRLELQAALLAVRLAITIGSEHDLKPSRRYFWTDSMNVLGWLRTEGRSLKTFVANRVGEISEESQVEEWRWLPTSLNVADDATRIGEGVTPRWLQGPSFLLLSPDSWPSETSLPVSEECLREFKTSVAVHVTTEDSQPPRLLPAPIAADPTRFSSWLRMVRVSARAHQYIQILRHFLNSKSNSDRLDTNRNHRIHQPPSATISHLISFLEPLKAEDLLIAEQHVIQRSQRESFLEEFEALRKHTSVEKRSRLWKLSPYLDAEGIIRLRGRIESAEIPTSFKRPIVLDGRHYAVRLLLANFHRKAAHAHPNLIINEVRQRFWILRLRTTIRSIVLRCSWCILKKSKFLSPPIGDLPQERLAHHRRPFTYVGLDYMGPILVTIRRRHEKRYIALFTCLTARAIHLELVASLSTDSALMALKRFIARRGTPRKIFSDNGTAFVGTNNILKALAEAGANSGIYWSFQPPAAPHMSGVWERLVRSVKTALRAMLQDRAPKEELLHTAMLEAEALINSRPLTNVPVDPDAVEALTPFHFIIGSSSHFHPVPVHVDNGDLLSRSDWRKSQRLADMFWGRWVREYLPLLLPRGSSVRTHRSVAVGDIVLVVDPSLPIGTWPRGRVSKVFPGRDGVIRVAEVSTAGGSLRRPLTKLVQLSVSTD